MGDIINRTVPVFQYEEPNTDYDIEEYQIRFEPGVGAWFAGNDSGCSCYPGFDEENFTRFSTLAEVQQDFSRWISGWRDGRGLEAAAWEAFYTETRKPVTPLTNTPT